MNVLIIIDMQEASFENSNKYDSDGVINRINQLSQHTRENGGTVIFIQHDGNEEEGLLPHTPGWRILSSLQFSDSDIIVLKKLNDSFSNTELNQTLVELGADKARSCVVILKGL